MNMDEMLRRPRFIVWNKQAGQFEDADDGLCTARWASPGGGADDFHVTGDICARPGVYQIGDVWLCEHHAVRATKWRDERSGEGDIYAPLMDTCVVPRRKAGVGQPAVLLCGAPVTHQVGPIGVCDVHYGPVWQWHLGQVSLADREVYERQQAAERTRKRKLMRWDADGPQVVYYIRRESDGLIKIGTSRVLGHRMSALRKEHGNLDLLLTHCGAHGREHRIHGRFSALRAAGEWFRPESELLAWILEVRRKPQNAATVLAITKPVEYVESLAGRSADPAA